MREFDERKSYLPKGILAIINMVKNYLQGGIFMNKTSYTVSQAAKIVGVETHVLRFWEEELLLDIGRNAKGYRVYTQENINTLLKIKELKKNHQLKEIREILGDSGKKRQQFYEIMEKVITKTLEEKNSPEGRYKQIDKAIRHHQHARKLIAATGETSKKRKIRKSDKKIKEQPDK